MFVIAKLNHINQQIWLVFVHSSLFTDLAEVTNHIQDNFNQDAGSAPTQEPVSQNNLTGASPNDSSFGLDQNLNLTLRSKPTLGTISQSQAIRPPSLSLLSPLNKPDPSEVDDEAPLTSDSSPDSNLILSLDSCMDPDVLNGNMTSDTVLSNTKLTCETNNTIITWVIKLNFSRQWLN